MDPGFDENEPELGILVLPAPLKMLPDGHSLLDEEVHVLGQVGCEGLGLEDSQNLVTSDETHLKIY